MQIKPKYQKYITLPRNIDWSYSSNRFVVLVTAATFIAYFLYTTIFLTQEIFDIRNLALPLQAGILSFLTWAIGREFDPDDPMTAMSAQVVVSICIGWFFPEFEPLLLALFLVLLGVRSVNNITGLKTTIWDSLAIAFAGVFTSVLTMNWVYALIAGFAIILDTLFKKDNLTNYFIAAISIGVSVYLMVTEGVYRYIVYLPPLFEYFMAFMMVVTIFIRFVVRRNITSSDDKGNKVDQKRVLAGAAFLIISMLMISIFGGKGFYVTASPIWAIAFVYPFIALFNRE